MRYYSTQRPIMTGTIPSEYEPDKIVNFKKRLWIKSIDRPAWGFVEYSCSLPDEVVKSYELTPEKDNNAVKLYYVRTNGYDMIIFDDGSIRRVLMDDSWPEMLDMSPDAALEAVEDVSSWTEYKGTVDELINIETEYDRVEAPKILAERDFK